MGRALRAVGVGAARDFVWADLRDGVLRLHGLSRGTRALVWLGFALLAAGLLLLLASDGWRAASVLLPLPPLIESRGIQVPWMLLPLTLFLFAIAWSYLLAGALHSHPLLRLLVLALYTLFAGTWALLVSGVQVAGPPVLLLLWGGLVGVWLLFGLRWRRAARPLLEWGVLLALVAALLVPAQVALLSMWRLTGQPLLFSQMQSGVGQFELLILPLLLLLGVDIADFVWRASEWGSGLALRYLPARVLPLLFFVLLLWRGAVVLREAALRVAAGTPGGIAVEYGAALGIPLLVAAAWWWVKRPAPPDELEPLSNEATARAAKRAAFPLILLLNGLSLLLTLGIAALLLPFIVLVVLDPQWGDLYQAILGGVDRLVAGGTLVRGWVTALSLGALGVARWLRGRGRRALALYLAVFGVTALWAGMTNPGGPLSMLDWRGPEPVEGAWTLLVVLTAGWWLRRGALDAPRAARLLLVLLILLLLRQSDFIENPFSPLLGSIGVGFLVFALAWDMLTMGAWANQGSRALPRVSRIFLYLGYVLLTIALIGWAQVSHDLNTVDSYTGGTALQGLELFGRPMLWSIMALALWGEGESMERERLLLPAG